MDKRGMTYSEVAEATELGRQMAVRKMIADPSSRERVESKFGLEFCMKRFPEVYQRPRGGIMKAIRNVFALSIFLLIFVGLAKAQDVVPPRISCVSGTCATLYTRNAAGTILNGGHKVSVTASTAPHLLMAASQNDCSSPGFAACNFEYVTSAGGAVLVTQNSATATAAGNVILALVETNGSAITQIAYPNQSGTVFTQVVGPIATYSTPPLPSAAGTIDVGSGAYPFRSIYLGTAGTNNVRLYPGTTTAARVVRLADNGAAGAFAFSDPTVTTQILSFNLAGATGTSVISSTLNARAITLADPGGAATIAYTNPTTPQTLTGTIYDTAGTGNSFKSNGSTVSSVAGVIGANQSVSSLNITDTNWHALNVTPITLPAGLANVAGKTLEITADGIYTNAAASLLNVGIALCTVSGCSSGTVWQPVGCNVTTTNQSNTLTNGQWTLRCTMVTVATGGTATFLAKSVVGTNLGNAASAVLSMFGDTATAVSATGDLTVAEYLSPMFKFSTSNGGNYATAQSFTVKLLN